VDGRDKPGHDARGLLRLPSCARMLVSRPHIALGGISVPAMSGNAFLELLKQEGVTTMFGNPGTTELSLMDALAVDNEMRYVLALQEAAVMAMADGYAQACDARSSVQADV